MAGSFVVERDSAGKFVFTLLAGTGEILLTSQRYDAKASVLTAIEHLRASSQTDFSFDRGTNKDGSLQFALRGGYGEVIGKSGMYRAAASMENGITSVKVTAPDAEVVDIVRADSPAMSLPSRSAAILLAWDPEILSSEEYAELVATIGDLARSDGAAGIQRILSETVGVSVGVGVLT